MKPEQTLPCILLARCNLLRAGRGALSGAVPPGNQRPVRGTRRRAPRRGSEQSRSEAHAAREAGPLRTLAPAAFVSAYLYYELPRPGMPVV